MATKLVSIRIPEDVLSNVKTLASQRGDIGYQQLIKAYVAEGVNRDQIHFVGVPINASALSSEQTNVISFMSRSFHPKRSWFSRNDIQTPYEARFFTSTTTGASGDIAINREEAPSGY